jgi:hypothetical protein
MKPPPLQQPTTKRIRIKKIKKGLQQPEIPPKNPPFVSDIIISLLSGSGLIVHLQYNMLFFFWVILGK